jgi:hypothetical protein
MLGNKMLTDVRQQVQHEQRGRRRMKVDAARGRTAGFCHVPATNWARKPWQG